MQDGFDGSHRTDSCIDVARKWCLKMRIGSKIRCGLVGALLLPALAQATVRWDRYAGMFYVPTPAPAIAYDNATGSGASIAPLDRLLAFSKPSADAPTTNYVDSGTSPQMQWTNSSQQLCNLSAGSASDACNKRAMGQISYALLRFPEAGTYSLALNHDDEAGVDFSTYRGGANYRDAAYEPAARLVGWVGEGTTAPAGTYNAAHPNACVLVRISWNNYGNPNHLGLHWSGPGIVDSELVPAANLLDPVAPSSECFTPTPTAVPTVGEYGLLLLAGMVALLGWMQLRRRV